MADEAEDELACVVPVFDWVFQCQDRRCSVCPSRDLEYYSLNSAELRDHVVLPEIHRLQGPIFKHEAASTPVSSDPRSHLCRHRRHARDETDRFFPCEAGEARGEHGEAPARL